MNPANEKQVLARIDQAERAIAVMRAYLKGAVVQISCQGKAKWHTLDTDKFTNWNWNASDYRVHPQSDTMQMIRKIKHRLSLLNAARQGVAMQYRVRDIKCRAAEPDRWFPVNPDYFVLVTNMMQFVEEYEFRDANTGEIYTL